MSRLIFCSIRYQKRLTDEAVRLLIRFNERPLASDGLVGPSELSLLEETLQAQSNRESAQEPLEITPVSIPLIRSVNKFLSSTSILTRAHPEYRQLIWSDYPEYIEQSRADRVSLLSDFLYTLTGKTGALMQQLYPGSDQSAVISVLANTLPYWADSQELRQAQTPEELADIVVTRIEAGLRHGRDGLQVQPGFIEYWGRGITYS